MNIFGQIVKQVAIIAVTVAGVAVVEKKIYEMMNEPVVKVEGVDPETGEHKWVSRTKAEKWEKIAEERRKQAEEQVNN